MKQDSRLVAVISGDGTIKTASAPLPPLSTGMVKIEVKSSLVSPGTEVGGWDQLAYQLHGHPTPHDPRTFGYSVAGVVTAIGEGVDTLSIGMRVAAVGAGYALHADTVVVPQRLCVPIPDDVAFDSSSFVMLLATALQAVRRGTPSIGEYWLVVGLGLVGILTARLLQLSGCFVTGIDEHQFRINLAQEWLTENFHHGKDGQLETQLQDFTKNSGFDGAVIAFGGEADSAMDTVVKSMKLSPDGHPEGTIVTVGWPRFSFSGLIGSMNNIDLRRASRTGPGYHDEEWERGKGYPPVFVRWTTQSNIALCLELIRRSQIDVDALITHRIPFSALETEIPKLLENAGEALGVVFTAD